MTFQGDIVLSVVGVFTLGIMCYSVTRYWRNKYMSAVVAPDDFNTI